MHDLAEVQQDALISSGVVEAEWHCRRGFGGKQTAEVLQYMRLCMYCCTVQCCSLVFCILICDGFLVAEEQRAQGVLIALLEFGMSLWLHECCDCV